MEKFGKGEDRYYPMELVELVEEAEAPMDANNGDWLKTNDIQWMHRMFTPTYAETTHTDESDDGLCFGRNECSQSVQDSW